MASSLPVESTNGCPGRSWCADRRRASAGGWRIGDLSVQPPAGTGIAPGEITARGTIVNGTLSATTASPDVLSSDPAAFFGSHVQRMVIESYVSAAAGQIRLGRGLFATAAPGIAVPAGAHRAIVELERGPMVALSPRTCEGLAGRLRRIVSHPRQRATVPWGHLTRHRTHSDRPTIGRIPGSIVTRALVIAAIGSHASDAGPGGGAGAMNGGHDARFRA